MFKPHTPYFFLGLLFLDAFGFAAVFRLWFLRRDLATFYAFDGNL
jgi:hypothetical protein